MPLDADLLELGIDLDRVDVPGAMRERDRRIRAAARADDQNVRVRPVREPPIDLPIELLDARLAERVECLVGNAVDRDVGQAARDL